MAVELDFVFPRKCRYKKNDVFHNGIIHKVGFVGEFNAPMAIIEDLDEGRWHVISTQNINTKIPTDATEE